MSSLNTVTLLGRVGRDPEVRNFQNGGRVVNLRIATSEKWKDRDGNPQERTEWHAVVIHNEKLADVVERFVKKGALLLVQGRLETRKWQDQAGQDRYSTEVVLRNYDARLIMMPTGDRDRGGDSADGASSPRERPDGRRESRSAGGTYQHQAAGSKDLPDDEIPF